MTWSLRPAILKAGLTTWSRDKSPKPLITVSVRSETMTHTTVPIKWVLYSGIERRIPAGPLPISPYTGNVFTGTMKEAQHHVEELRLLSRHEPVQCVRCKSAKA